MKKTKVLIADFPKQLIKRGLVTAFLAVLHFYVLAASDTYNEGSPPELNQEDLFQTQARGGRQQNVKIAGTVYTDDQKPIPGATIRIKGTSKGMATNADGAFSIDVSPQDTLVVSFLGYETKEVVVKGRSAIHVSLKEASAKIEDLTIVAFGKQRKESVVSSIETVKVTDLKVPSSNLTSAFAGRMAGLIAYQRTGEPGRDNAQFFVRGVTTFGYSKSPLILIDNIELSATELARLQVDDIASFSIMKDATATALYGARGANGVIFVTTKEGREGKPKVSIRIENSFSMPTQEVKLADNITFMKALNEAILLRDPLGIPRYSVQKIYFTEKGADPTYYPNNNWKELLTNKYTMNQRANFNVTGGGKVARYFLAGSFNQDNGNLKKPEKNPYNNNISIQKYSIRSNINLNLTKTTEVAFRFNAGFTNYNGPIYTGEQIYNMSLFANPVMFAPYYKPDEANRYTKHILYGNAETGGWLNPYAELTRGYNEANSSLILSQFQIDQSLDEMVKGLSVRFIYNDSRKANTGIRRYTTPYYYSPLDPSEGYVLKSLNPSSGQEYLTYSESSKDVVQDNYYEGSMRYSTELNEAHAISGALIFIAKQTKYSNPGTLQKSLPYRNLGISGRFTYGLLSRYMLELNFGYNGSERFARNERFGFFPSVGLGYIVSKENFFKPLEKVVTNLKLKATYGLVGNDAIGNENDRFFFLSEVNMNNEGRSGTFGNKFAYSKNGISIGRYENDKISWEVAQKYNLGFELELFNSVKLNAEYFGEKRSNILMDRLILANMGLEPNVGLRANMGKAENQGVDISLNANYSNNNGFWISSIANFTYAKNRMTRYEEPDYSKTPWVSRVGRPINQVWGYIAERLFVDEAEISNSPTQFGKVLPGDIKYRDINGDGKITPLDQVPIGNPTVPEIVYGFGVSMGFHRVDFSCFLQGSARSSFWINPTTTAPFRPAYRNPVFDYDQLTNSGLLQAYADNRWSPENKNLYALWPRLSETPTTNNTQTSTWFMRDGAFVRLKSVEIGYTFNVKHIERLRVYVTGNNLMVFSRFKLWDPEMGGSGLGYPIQRIFNIGIQANF